MINTNSLDNRAMFDALKTQKSKPSVPGASSVTTYAVTSMKDLKRASRDGKKAISAMIREHSPALARTGYRKPKSHTAKADSTANQ